MGAFSKSAESFSNTGAVIIDDLGGFFSANKSLLQRFVSQRGGGFMMLGGAESFAEGTSIAHRSATSSGLA